MTTEQLIDEMWELINKVSPEEFDKIFDEKRKLVENNQ